VVNRKDNLGRNIFQGGFLGLDNIGVFDRSAKLHRRLHQSVGRHQLDGDVRAQSDAHRAGAGRAHHVYEDIASKFFEHFLNIAEAMSSMYSNDEGSGMSRISFSTMY